MKNSSFFYRQYDKLKWANQKKTKVNFEIFKAIGRYIKSQHRGPLAIFDIGCGIGSLFDLLTHELRKQNDVIFEGCEPSAVNYGYFLKKAQSTFKKSTKITVKNTDFLSVITKTKFDFITAVYVFPHFIAEQLPMTARKIHTMLKSHGRFLLVVANESYLRNRLQSEKKIFIEKNTLLFHKRKFEEWMHYSDIRQIGTVIDLNRPDAYYIELFKENRMNLILTKVLKDSGALCTLFVFEKA